LSQVVEDHSID